MKKFKIFHKHIVLLVASGFIMMFASCDDMLTLESNRYVTSENHQLKNSTDSVSSILGLLSGMQKIADRYVLMGEMRADLLDVTPLTTADIRELSNFKVRRDNPFADPRDYYALINNCNYFISRTNGDDHPLKNEHALARTIRAWTYMQVASIWGQVYYTSQALLTVDDTHRELPLLQPLQLVDSLINDLSPFEKSYFPNYGTINNFPSSRIFPSLRLLLADLYLWRGSSPADYEKAATLYAEVIDEKYQAIQAGTMPSVRWSYDNFIQQNFETAIPSNSWSASTVASSTSTETVSAILMAANPSEGRVGKLPLKLNEFGFSTVIDSLWGAQRFTLRQTSGAVSINYYVAGDLRKQANLSGTFAIDEFELPALYKLLNCKNILTYRMGLVWLRYAEAVNRTGKPHTAFAVLKYGLKPAVFNDPAKIPIRERELAKSYLAPFNTLKYEWMTGVHARGCGDVAFDDDYDIAAFADGSMDTLQWVENAIIDELALETSFEGNRFADLLRISQRRNNPDYLARKIASKHRDNYQSIYQTLCSDTKNWFLPEPLN